MTSEHTGLRGSLADGRVVLGSWLSFAFPPVTEMFARAGFDFLVIDQEHAAIGAADTLSMIQVIDLAGAEAWVRVGANDPRLIKRALDSGATGIVVPMVSTPEEAEAAVSASRYPPRGTRGAGLFRAQDYGLGFAEYRPRADSGTTVVVQIEHIDAVRNLESILAVPGIDAFMVGPYDLSGSVGQPGAYDHPDVTWALAEVERVMGVSSVPGGFHVVHSGDEELLRRLNGGYRLIAYGDDMVFLAEKLRHEAERMKRAAEPFGWTTS
jgi:2-keto-3-deoxy-L-rhamnonate aldolase RhmA